MYLQPITEDQATGRVAEIYEAQKAQMGFVMETAKAFTPRPDLLPIYTDFIEKVRGGFSLDLRDWRLITLVAAKQVPSTYCSYVYGKQLLGDLGSRGAVLNVQKDFGMPVFQSGMLRCWPMLNRSPGTLPGSLKQTSIGCAP